MEVIHSNIILLSGSINLDSSNRIHTKRFWVTSFGCGSIYGEFIKAIRNSE